jgi:hypothetical protein
MNGLRQNFDNQATWIVHCAVNLFQENRVIVLGDSDTGQFALHYAMSLQKLAVYRGDGVTLLQETAAGSVLQNVWHHLIFKVVVGNSGSYEVRLNGATILSGSGVDTQQTANAYANQVCFCAQRFHDIVILDGTGAAPHNDILGDVRVNCLIASGAGGVTGWTPSAGSNFQNVDDSTPDSDTTYNSATAAATVDTYATTNPTLNGVCRGIQVAALCRKDDAGVRTLRPVYRDAGSSTNYTGTTRNLADSYTFQEDIWPVHPGTGVAFTATQLNNAECGVELIS